VFDNFKYLFYLYAILYENIFVIIELRWMLMFVSRR